MTTIYDFSYFGHAMLGQKINKKQSKINQKTDFESTPKLESILEPTWLHFGKVFGAKMGPSWDQISPKINLQMYQTNDIILARSWDQFWASLGPNLAPKRRNFCLQIRAFKVLGTILGPRCPQDPPKTLQDPPRPLQEALQDRFSAPSSWILGSMWVDVCTNLEWFLVLF